MQIRVKTSVHHDIQIMALPGTLTAILIIHSDTGFFQIRRLKLFHLSSNLESFELIYLVDLIDSFGTSNGHVGLAETECLQDDALCFKLFSGFESSITLVNFAPFDITRKSSCHCKSLCSSKDEVRWQYGFQLYNEAEIQPSVLVLQQRSPLFTQVVFIVATVLLLSWPYRLLVYSRTAKLNYPFRKVLRILPTKSHRCGYKYHPRASNSNEWRNNEAFIMENPLADRDDSLLPSDSDDELLSLDIRYTSSD
ncbi:hypothetical protein ACTXT7_007717 [Hymenolepis weldensis]